MLLLHCSSPPSESYRLERMLLACWNLFQQHKPEACAGPGTHQRADGFWTPRAAPPKQTRVVFTLSLQDTHPSGLTLIGAQKEKPGGKPQSTAQHKLVPDLLLDEYILTHAANSWDAVLSTERVYTFNAQAQVGFTKTLIRCSLDSSSELDEKPPGRKRLLCSTLSSQDARKALTDMACWPEQFACVATHMDAWQ